MENYTKGEVIEEKDEKLPFKNLDDNFIHMKVRAGSKINHIIGSAITQFKEDAVKQIVFSGTDGAIPKTISCVEIMKGKHKSIYQITRIGKRRIEEIWEPKIEGLDRLKVNRDIPSIHILLSKESLDESELGYQHGKTCSILRKNSSKPETDIKTTSRKTTIRPAGKKRKQET